MAVKFDFDASDALAQTLKLQAGFLAVGKEAGSAEQKLAGMASDVVKLLQSTDRYFNEVLKSGRVSKSSMEEFGKAQSATQKSVLAGVQQIIQQNLQLTLQSNAYKGSLKELQALLKDSSAQQSYVKYAKLMGNLSAENVEQNKYLRASISHLSKEEAQLNLQLKAQLAAYSRAVTASTRQKLANKELQATIAARSTEEGKLSVRLKARLASEDKVATAAYRQQLTNKELKKELELLGSAYGLGNAKIKARIKLAQEEAQQGTLLAGKLASLQREYAGLQGGVQAIIASQTVRNKGMAEAATFEQREANLLAELQRKNESLNGGLAEQAAILRTLNAAREKEVTELARETAQVEQLRRALTSLNGGQQEQIVLLNAQIAARKKAILGTEQEIKAATAVKAVTESVKTATVALTAAMATAAVAKERQKAATDRHNAALMEEARTLSRLTQVEAAGIAKTEALTAANKRHSEALLDEARKIHGVSKAQLDLIAIEDREREKLASLQAQVHMLSSARGREQAALQKAIAEQTAYNRLLTMSTAELLGFTGAQKRANLAMMAGSQTAAMLRAGLAGAGSSIGMYTSATVLAASATYAIAASLRSALTTGSEFTAAMSRVNAVMSVGGETPKWLQDMGQLEAMSETVRAVGMSTSFTASETAEGLNQLAMAGLGATDAIAALEPALNLALIGNISMAESADLATNVMMTFGVGAKESASGVADLTEVVDIMAAAASNSNTNIQQLAGALSYAGPAAATAGISMRDTVAAIEALSNSGIKSSRAGTALRKMFVSMLNPTKKGAAMMDEYGISVKNAEGETRGLIDIVGQLNSKLSGLSGGDRLSAIQNLVGIYASSPVAALVDQHDNLVRLRAQLNEVSGAAEEMRKKISDNLTFDWKGVTSAFEEVKIAAFKTQETNLRVASAELTKWLISLTEVAETKIVAGKTIDVTHLEVLLEKATRAAEAFGWMTAAVLTFKIANGSVFAAAAADLTSLSARLTVLAANRAAATATEARESLVRAEGTLVTNANTTALTANTAATVANNAAATGGINKVANAATKAATLATLAAGAVRFLGWAGMIASIGYSLYSLFQGGDIEDGIANQKSKVDDLKSSYDSLRESIENTADAKGREANQSRIKADSLSIEQLKSRKDEYLASIEAARSSGQLQVVSGFEAEIAKLDSSIASYEKSITSAQSMLGNMGGAWSLTTEKTLAAQSDLLRELSAAEQRWKSHVDNAPAINTTGTPREKRLSVTKRRAYDSVSKDLRFQADQVKDRLGTQVAAPVKASALTQSLTVTNASRLAQDTQAANEAQYLKTASAAEKLVAVEKEWAVVQKELSELQVRHDTASTLEDQPGTDELDRAYKKQADLLAQRAELREEVTADAKAHKEKEAALVAVTATEQQQLAQTLQGLAEVKKARDALAAGVKASDPVAIFKDNQLLDKQTELLQKKVSLQKSASGSAGSTDKDAQAYDSLLKKIDPVKFSLDELTKNTELLARMRERGDISAQQEKKALTEMATLHYELTLKQNDNYQSLKKIQDAYLESPYAPAISDLIELNRLQRETNGGVKDYAVLSAAMKEKNKQAVLSGAPTAPTNLGDSASTPFGESVGTLLEKANGDAWYRKRHEQVATGQTQELAGINQDFDAQRKAAELLSAQEQANKLVEIEKNRNEAIKQSHANLNDAKKALTDQAAAYDQQTAQMMKISMVGQLESIFGMMAATGEGATNAQKAAFVAQKALAIAQILMYTHLAAAQAMTIPGDSTKVMGLSLAAFITAQGYASAGLVGALAVAEVSGGGRSAGAFDDGGFIPYNSYGIVGEYGPEIVHGPANVTSREKSAKKLGGGGSAPSITLAPAINIQMAANEGGVSNEDAMKQAKQVADMTKSLIMATLKDQTRPNGALDNWLKANRS